MANDNRPRSRKRNVTGVGSGVHRRGEGTGGGPVGSSGRPQGGRGGGSRGPRSPLPLIVLVLALLFGGGGALGGLFGGGSSDGGTSTGSYTSSGSSSGTSSASSQSGSSAQTGSDYVNSFFNGGSGMSTGWSGGSTPSQEADTSVASGAREKRTKILGNGKDEITIMVYMCGTDLESRSGMATSDLQEMATAKFGDNIHLLVYTGGCASWRNNVVSSDTNQIYQIADGKMIRHVSNAGRGAMTDPATLSSFIKWSAENFPANRYELIFWDHGGGSVSGYGYDEKNRRMGSMSLSGIGEALRDGGVTFDFIGFDTCLLATLENALMLDEFGDYMVASEETEPGVGWYYTNWLTDLGRNTSMPTLEIGQEIVDTFTEACARKCPGQKTTLSVIDLAELTATVPAPFKEFSKGISQMISDKDYRTVSTARNRAREFAASSKIDQVDLVHFALNLGTPEAQTLAQAVRGAVKYNRTSSNMTNAYGLSIFFPLRSVKYVDSMSKTYSEIKMDTEYTKAIRQFASMEVSGQAASGGTGSPYGSLFGDYAGEFSGLSGSSSSELIGELLYSFLGGDMSSISGLSGASSFLSDRALSDEETLAYVRENHFDVNQLAWYVKDGKEVIHLSEDQWGLVSDLELNMFYDDGEGYVDLGLDNVFDFDGDGDLIADAGKTWISINNQPVAYYHVDTLDDGDTYTITGRVPCLLNGERTNLILVFDNDNPNGYIAGASADYSGDEEVLTIAKNMTELETGDKIDFLCDFYSYDGTFRDSYMLGDQMEVTENMTVSDTILDGGKTIVTYKFTDIYEKEYWTQSLDR